MDYKESWPTKHYDENGKRWAVCKQCGKENQQLPFGYCIEHFRLKPNPNQPIKRV